MPQAHGSPSTAVWLPCSVGQNSPLLPSGSPPTLLGHSGPLGLVTGVDLTPKQASPLTLFVRDRADATFPQTSPASTTASVSSLRLSRRPAFPLQRPKALPEASDPITLPEPPGPPPSLSRGSSCVTPLARSGTSRADLIGSRKPPGQAAEWPCQRPLPRPGLPAQGCPEPQPTTHTCRKGQDGQRLLRSQTRERTWGEKSPAAAP